jgi:hypothetical protein
VAAGYLAKPRHQFSEFSTLTASYQAVHNLIIFNTILLNRNSRVLQQSASAYIYICYVFGVRAPIVCWIDPPVTSLRNASNPFQPFTQTIRSSGKLVLMFVSRIYPVERLQLLNCVRERRVLLRCVNLASLQLGLSMCRMRIGRLPMSLASADRDDYSRRTNAMLPEGTHYSSMIFTR